MNNKLMSDDTKQIYTDLSELPVICIMGPTASGKTALAMALYDHLPCDIISVDSALVYRGMDIGTAKPTPEELANYPHQLIDIRDPAQTYSAAEFCQDALKAIEQSRSNGRIPILVGGTMMYFKSLIDGISPLPEADAGIRKAISLEAQTYGWEKMHQQLASFDPVAAKRIHPNDRQRISRAIEIYRKTTKTITELVDKKGQRLNGKILQFAILPNNRQVLHERIAIRFQQMITQHFQQEVQALIARGDLHENLPSIRCVGYRQMWQYLHGQYDHQEMIFKGVCATRQLAKRQLTWLRNWPHCHHLPMGNKDNLQLMISILSKC